MTSLAFAKTGSTSGGRFHGRRTSRRSRGGRQKRGAVLGESLFSLAGIRISHESLPDLAGNKTLSGEDSVFGRSSVTKDRRHSGTLGAAVERHRVSVRRVQFLEDSLDIVVEASHELGAEVNWIAWLVGERLRGSRQDRIKLSYGQDLNITLSVISDLSDPLDRSMRLGQIIEAQSLEDSALDSGKSQLEDGT